MPEKHNGRVYWLTGLPGAGKTTIGRLFYQHLRTHQKNVVFLDGDTLREIFGDRFGYTPEDRLAIAKQYGRLCKLLASQGLDVIIATVSLFEEIWRWNRENLEDYCEIYVRVPMTVLLERDQKQLYSRALRGEIENVIGVQLEVTEPTDPHHILENNGSASSQAMLETLLTAIDCP